MSDREANSGGWRYRLGLLMFSVPFVLFFGAPLVIPMLGFSAGQSAALIGGIIVGAEVIWFASIPLLGVQGFKRVKAKAFGFLKLPVGRIGRTRHKIGVAVFLSGVIAQLGLSLAVLVAYLQLGNDSGASIAGLSFDEQAMIFAVTQLLSFACLVAGIYLLGADFMERIRRAFDWAETDANRQASRS